MATIAEIAEEFAKADEILINIEKIKAIATDFHVRAGSALIKRLGVGGKTAVMVNQNHIVIEVLNANEIKIVKGDKDGK